ncbi:Metacaspase-1 [Golovinomyces cichoracearum]|uniref:Metacaspase-1 n=1 Tax=Golovinomyces cichoracearum TaxID=62708 RepID=A0A420ILX2_9PEZI|nr:Metacaspase-1 [Golovinomyces cichoracearum]
MARTKTTKKKSQQIISKTQLFPIYTIKNLLDSMSWPQGYNPSAPQGNGGYPAQQYQQPGGHPAQQYQQPGGYPAQQYQQPGGYPAQHYQQGGYPGQQYQHAGYGAPPPQQHYDHGQWQGQPNYPTHGPPPPPQGTQQFRNGAPQDYSYQYSNCSGRRKALLIGINYFGQKGELRGCINDVRNVSAYLRENHGYRSEDMVTLTGKYDQQNPMSQPTKENILRAMGWLVQGCQQNDALFFHFSGHGGQTEDIDGDEDDGHDEVIYPVDYKRAGHIVDDQIHHILVKPLPAGARLTAIFDSCHSGSCLDLPYIYSTQGLLKEPNLAKEAGQGLLGILSSASQDDFGGAAKQLIGFFQKATKGDGAHKKSLATKTSPADVIMFSGSKDNQTSADATIASQATGAMSWAFITAMKKNPNQSYVQLLNSIREVLATKYSQKPQLSCSHPIDTNLRFIM